MHKTSNKWEGEVMDEKEVEVQEGNGVCDIAMTGSTILIGWLPYKVMGGYIVHMFIFTRLCRDRERERIRFGIFIQNFFYFKEFLF